LQNIYKQPKLQGFTFVSKIIDNKPCTTKQKQKNIKQRHKRHEIKKQKKGKKNLIEKITSGRLSTPNSCKKECKGLVQDSSTNSNTPTITM
jgi:hypothetical protein